MKVALFHATLPEPDRKLGGVEVVVHRLANALVQSGGIDVKVYSLSAAPPEARYRHQRLFGGARFLRSNPAGRLLLLPALLNFVSFEPADVLHFHGDDWFYVRRTMPTVRTFHGSALFEAQAARRFLRKVEQYLVYGLEQLSARLRSRLLTFGAHTKLYALCQQTDSGVDLELFHPGEKTAHPQILFVGTWTGRKRGDFLFHLFVNEILPAYPETRLCMVSDFCPKHPAVIFRQYPRDRELAQCYRESWVVAHPSTYEGFGMVYAEALASGTSVITSPNEGAAHVLSGGRYGVVADDSEFASRLKELLASAALRAQLARDGLERAAQLSWAAVAARHKAIYYEAAHA